MPVTNPCLLSCRVSTHFAGAVDSVVRRNPEAFADKSDFLRQAVYLLLIEMLGYDGLLETRKRDVDEPNTPPSSDRRTTNTNAVNTRIEHATEGLNERKRELLRGV